ncbi:MAG: hypothetical protein KAI71_02835 [Candidatus Pacebacteria bacterium]|nr:hypothetical protein [Candidatus Paceibacterota bacterium]
MSNKCSLQNIEIEDLTLYELQSLVVAAIRIISDINSDSCERSARVIKIAALLPELTQMEKIIAEAESQIHRDMQVVKLENTRYLADTVNTMRGAYSLLMQKDPHTHEIELIEALGKVTEIHITEEPNQREWKERLLQTLLDNKSLNDHTAVWIDNFESIKKLIEVFDLPKEELNQMIENTFKSDAELHEISFWINNREKIEKLIEFFDLSKENIHAMVISALTNDERMKNLEILTTNPHGLKELIKIFSLPKEKVQATIIQQLNESIEALSGVFSKEKDDIISKLDFLLEIDLLPKCIKSIKIMNLNIDPILYMDVIEEFIKRANGYASEGLREKTIKIAIKTYKALKEIGIDIENREIILFTYEQNNKHPIDKTMRVASRVIGFNYINHQGLKGSWPLRLLFGR